MNKIVYRRRNKNSILIRERLPRKIAEVSLDFVFASVLNRKNKKKKIENVGVVEVKMLAG